MKAGLVCADDPIAFSPRRKSATIGSEDDLPMDLTTIIETTAKGHAATVAAKVVHYQYGCSCRLRSKDPKIHRATKLPRDSAMVAFDSIFDIR